MAAYQPAAPVPREFFQQPQRRPPELRQPAVYSDGGTPPTSDVRTWVNFLLTSPLSPCFSAELRRCRSGVGAAGPSPEPAGDFGESDQPVGAGCSHPGSPASQPHQVTAGGGPRGPEPRDSRHRGAAPHPGRDPPGFEETGLHGPVPAPAESLPLPAQPVQASHRQAVPEEGTPFEGRSEQRHLQLFGGRRLRHASVPGAQKILRPPPGGQGRRRSSVKSSQSK